MPLKLLSSVRVLALMMLVGSTDSASATSEPQRIYRCGDAYTNQADFAANCKPLAGGRVTVIEGAKVQGSSATRPSFSANGGAMKVDKTAQHQRDAQAQTVLQVELQKAFKQHADLLREWNNGESEHRADEFRQPQKYQDRVAQLRGALQRELSRLFSVPTGGKP
jgi:hypothetical protein